YLPRLFVYHVDTRDQAGHERFCLMERRLYALTTIGMIGTWVFGITLLMMTPGYLQMGWFHAKLTLVLALSGYHGWLKGRLRAFTEQRNNKSARYYRIANEVPAVAMVVIVIFVVVKPF
ncbi:MAG: CopD family protein, partial [Pseudomonadota bacterium]|nr:CopD family protein [Pseudomonadota bacterium]